MRVSLNAWMACALLSFAAAGCATDLGECDEAMLGGSDVPGNLVPHTGQLVMQQSCAGGRCHSADATGAARVGVPAGFNFDVVPSDSSPQALAKVSKAASTVQDEAEEIWAEVDEGAMPPAGPAGSGPLGADEKEALRNWLACGAEVIPAPAATGSDPWSQAYGAMIGTCAGCHGSATYMVSGQGFLFGDLGDPCAAYDNVVGNTSVNAACGEQLVVPGDPQNSLLLQKLEGTQPQNCGAYMPFAAPMPYAQTNPDAVAQLRQWIMSGAPRPESCM